ncbi:galactokinase [Spirochaetia bacterium]|nr:galactokinase [Spirochaetia bacterium]
MDKNSLSNLLKGNSPVEALSAVYGEREFAAARSRFARLLSLVDQFPPQYGFGSAENTGEVRLFSAPGRTELAGNHTDHNRGCVLAGAIQLDTAAVVIPRKDKKVFYRSQNYPDVEIDLSDLSPRPAEKGATEALIRGIAAEMAARGIEVKGFAASGNSTVLPGSGLSSSAAVEVLVGRIFDSLCGDGRRSALELAQIGQKAENIYFGKPCGLMDQTACAAGGAVAIDFADPQKPLVREIQFDPEAAGYALCVVNTRGSHADLTPDYAAIPGEMKAAAAFFGKEVLREVDPEVFADRIAELRKKTGDRAVLRTIHFIEENARVKAMENCLVAITPENMNRYLALVNESGNSSWELLQNVYSPRDPAAQGLSLALAMTKKFLRDAADGKGACRVHGGGFAGTIQAYIPLQNIEEYRRLMDKTFGENSVTPLRIRPQGAVEIKLYTP